ncbi:MAG: glycosyltransferase [Candidatus Cloacimonadales bacterium]|jgi:glycosyltransferase involved in cell wall biosynthesis|nr:glycosyltransferase [Candidatus Cloacimonadota bacterium]MDX9976402.1 glycosyltransferase [Candidatus Cloacimonadales bacterium]
MFIIYLFACFIVLLIIGIFLNKVPKDTTQTRFSIVIACKNEESNLPDLFAALEAINYPERDFETILIDDNSSDDSFRLMQEFALKKASYHALRLDYPEQGKKRAITKAIDFAMYPYIVLTDADCRPNVDWLSELSKHIYDKKDMLIGFSPEINNSQFRKFVYLITASFYASTCGLSLPFSCTGRHLVIKKSTFKELGGYKGFEHKVSGDDKLLLNKFYRNKKRIAYMYQPAVNTLPVNKTLRKQQDLRRFGKLNMSNSFWQIISVLIAVIMLVSPYFIYRYSLYIELGLIYLLALIYLFISAKKHKEQFYPSYAFIILFYPYFLIFKSIQGTFRRWTWK